MKKMLFLMLATLATGGSAQVYNNTLPVTCNPNAPGDCIKSTPVVNPDGSLISGGGGSGGGGGGNTTDVQGSGTLNTATLNSTYVIPLTGGRSSIGARISGLTGSGATITVERTNDGGTTWTNANTTESNATGSLSATLTADGQPRIGAAGATAIRFRVSTVGTGTVSIAYNATAGVGPVFFVGYVPGRATADGTIIGGIDNRTIVGNTISVGAGATDAGTQRLSLATDGTYAKDATLTGGAQVARATGVTSGGAQVQLLASSIGVLAAPTAAVAQSTGTVTAVAANTSTTICPATTNPVVYEVQIYGTAPVLLGLDGQALTAVTPAAGSGAYMLLPTQYTLYVGPVARTNIITAYTATAQTVVCNIVTRQ